MVVAPGAVALLLVAVRPSPGEEGCFRARIGPADPCLNPRNTYTHSSRGCV